MMALADSLGAYATVLNLSGGRWTTTIESKTNFFAPAPVGSEPAAGYGERPLSTSRPPCQN